MYEPKAPTTHAQLHALRRLIMTETNNEACTAWLHLAATAPNQCAARALRDAILARFGLLPAEEPDPPRRAAYDHQDQADRIAAGAVARPMNHGSTPSKPGARP